MKCEGTLCDLELVVTGESILCNKSVLAASSEYFRYMFKYNFMENTAAEGGRSKVVLESIETETERLPEVVNATLFYIYCGVLPFNLDLTLIPDIFCVAHLWLLEELQEICVTHMTRQAKEYKT